MKLRIIYGPEPFPYKIQRKKWFSWILIDESSSMAHAETKLAQLACKPQLGQVLKVYDDMDRVIDKLKGKQ